jgi:hypothetical protein
MGFLQRTADVFGRLVSPSVGRAASIALHEAMIARLRQRPQTEDVRARIRLYEERLKTLRASSSGPSGGY